MSAEQKTDAPAQNNIMTDVINKVVASYKALDKRQLSTVLYQNILDADPVVKARFQGQNMRLLASSFIGIMSIVLDELKSMNVSECDARMQSLGGRHVGYNVGVNMFATFQACLLSALGKVLGDAFTPELKYAWSFAWSTFVTSPLINGWKSKAKIDKKAALATVTKSFEAMKTNKTFIDTLFNRVFSQDPSIKNLFSSTDMEGHKQKFIGFIGKGLEFASGKGDGQAEFKKLAAMHKTKGVKVSHFAFFEEAILTALRAAMGAEFTGDLADHWTIVMHCEMIEPMVAAPFQEILAMLTAADTDGDGIVTLQEWNDALSEYGSKDELSAAYKRCDADGNGTVESVEFTRMLARQQLKYPLATIKEQVQYFVKNATAQA